MNRDPALGLLLVAATLLTYLPAWNGLPVWDDNMHMTPPGLRSLEGLVRIWTHTRETMQYFPLTHTILWAEANLWGDSTLGYHLVSILLHACSALMLVKVLRKLGISGAWLAAAVFALHPVMVESVAWISELKNTLSGVFFFAAAATYLTYAGDGNRRSYALALGLFVLGLLSKSTIAIFPLAMLAALWWKRDKLSWKQDIVPLLPFGVLGVLFGVITLRVEHTHFIAADGSFRLSVIERCLLVGRATWFYLGKLLLPLNLTFSYPRWSLNAAVWWQYLFPAAALAAGAVLWTLRKVSRAPAAALLYFTATLLPYLGFFSFYTFRYSFVADHYQYLAAAGPIAFAVGWAEEVLGPLRGIRSQLKTAVSAMLLLALASLSWRQSGMYSDADTLYRTTIERNAGSWMAHNELGMLMAKAGRNDQALSHYQVALALNPDSIEAHNNMGLLLSSMGRIGEALSHYQKVLSLNPNHAKTHNNLANLLTRMGRRDEALVHYQKALEINPDFAEFHNNIGLLLSEMGRTDEALAHYEKALEVEPNRGDVELNLGNLLSEMGRRDDALARYYDAVRMEPNNSRFHYAIGLLLSNMGRRSEAMSHYRKVLELTPNDVDAYNNLGILLARNGEIDEALAHFRRALEIKPDAIGPLTNFGLALTQKGRLADAAPVLERALVLARSTGDEARERNIAQVVARIHKTIDSSDPSHANAISKGHR